MFECVCLGDEYDVFVLLVVVDKGFWMWCLWCGLYYGGNFVFGFLNFYCCVVFIECVDGWCDFGFWIGYGLGFGIEIVVEFGN